MRVEVFTDKRYHSEKFIEIDPAQVVSAEEKQVSLVFAGKHDVTEIKLADGLEYVLTGKLKQAIEDAKNNSEPRQ